MIQDGKYTWQKQYSLKYSEKDAEGRLKASVFLGLLEDLAWEAASRIGIGFEDVTGKNAAWFLLKYHMQFIRYPQTEESLVIKTEARGISRLYALRDFEIYAPDSSLMGRVVSQWGLIDISQKSLIRPDSLFTWMPSVQKREGDLAFASLKAPDSITGETSFRVRYDDIDINRHVNNSCYLAWALEALPHIFRQNHAPKSLDILFKKEADPSSLVLSQVYLGERSSDHVLKNKDTGETLCLIKGHFYGSKGSR